MSEDTTLMMTDANFAELLSITKENNFLLNQLLEFAQSLQEGIQKMTTNPMLAGFLEQTTTSPSNTQAQILAQMAHANSE
jgi:hypothetical protein